MKCIFAKEKKQVFDLQLTHEWERKKITQHKVICITGTDTGIGKTVVTGLLAKEIGRFQSVVTQKWVQSGDLDAPDIQTHDQIANASMESKWLPDRQVYSFIEPVSPHLAAQLANQPIEQTKLINATQRLSESFDTVLVETSGGIMVPLTDHMTTGDVLSAMKLPTIVVVPNKLGTINHSLLTMNGLKQQGIPILGFILNQLNHETTPMHENNPTIISALSGIKKLGVCQVIE